MKSRNFMVYVFVFFYILIRTVYVSIFAIVLYVVLCILLNLFVDYSYFIELVKMSLITTMVLFAIGVGSDGFREIVDEIEKSVEKEGK